MPSNTVKLEGNSRIVKEQIIEIHLSDRYVEIDSSVTTVKVVIYPVNGGRGKSVSFSPHQLDGSVKGY